MKNILVTGGTSYIGKHCIAQLIEKGYSVRTTIRDIKRADEIKSDPQWKHAGDWHWCTIPDGEDYETGKHKGQAVEKVNEFIKTLKRKNTTTEEKQVALKFLVHLVGDLHQPLHVGNGADRGGNSVRLKWFGESSNLHSIWDTKLIQHQNP